MRRVGNLLPTRPPSRNERKLFEIQGRRFMQIGERFFDGFALRCRPSFEVYGDKTTFFGGYQRGG